MTKQEQQDLKLIVYRMDEADKRVESLHKEFKNDLQELHTDIKFIKEKDIKNLMSSPLAELLAILCFTLAKAS